MLRQCVIAGYVRDRSIQNKLKLANLASSVQAALNRQKRATNIFGGSGLWLFPPSKESSFGAHCDTYDLVDPTMGARRNFSRGGQND